MTRQERAEKAVTLRAKGYTCSQSVACAYADLVDMSEEDLFRVSEGFGGGMGGLGSTCGAVTAMVILAGVVSSTANLENGNSKGKTIRLSRELIQAFEMKNQSVICRELKGMDTGIVLRSCPDCIKDAVLILGETLFPEIG